MLLELLADDETGAQRTLEAIGRKLDCKRHTMHRHLTYLAKLTPSQVQHAGRGNWVLTEAGIVAGHEKASGASGKTCPGASK